MALVLTYDGPKTTQDVATKYNVTTGDLDVLWLVIEAFKEGDVSGAQTFATLRGWDDTLRKAGIGAVADFDFRLEFQLTDVGKRMAADLITVKFPREVYLDVVRAAIYPHQFG